jgi:hypothetical protein
MTSAQLADIDVVLQRMPIGIAVEVEVRVEDEVGIGCVDQLDAS